MCDSIKVRYKFTQMPPSCFVWLGPPDWGFQPSFWRCSSRPSLPRPLHSRRLQRAGPGQFHPLGRPLAKCARQAATMHTRARRHVTRASMGHGRHPVGHLASVTTPARHSPLGGATTPTCTLRSGSLVHRQICHGNRCQWASLQMEK